MGARLAGMQLAAVAVAHRRMAVPSPLDSRVARVHRLAYKEKRWSRNPAKKKEIQKVPESMLSRQQLRAG